VTGRRQHAAADDHRTSAEASLIESQWQRSGGGDPSRLIRQGLEEVRRARDENPTDAAAPLLEAKLYAAWADWLAAGKRDPQEQVTAGLAALETARSLHPGLDETRTIRESIERSGGPSESWSALGSD
jgi:hypothetical protein